MAVTNYSERQQGDPDVEVRFDYEGQTVTGFIDARRQHDGVWEAWVWFSYDTDGWRATRKDWIRMDELAVLSVDDVPPSDCGVMKSPRFPRGCERSTPISSLAIRNPSGTVVGAQQGTSPVRCPPTD